ncbi:DEAD/DEAH box helicase [Clostridium tagluense]|uniref:DEAD/DEAH box helicase n=1 Tax=Clostridium tagluense TaxID=360422 RepID=UPI001CF1B4C3|nr:DEAD/DEAH box helicase [Clostridium tagluense]MCB2313459.1 DEAD/DEAH box helicase [Clostridium tagluense]MCB2318274.1 DEAD/DEAH box helicase [Clostridium tagluense]MCB2323076.1 DEAD/DEAH box helicase [Clostridium tagluense]MCB2328058.1 DEAD/DEAH box helicase [Clostridium tagluense]MCB2332786.1 DEAD/DEAH box helicase [Clostridium tagluense]
MFNIMNNKILEEFHKLKTQKSENPQLLVMKGFNREILDTLPTKKLFNLPLKMDIQDISKNKKSVNIYFYTNLHSFTKDNIYWCTYEEYIIFNEICSEYFEIKILFNNLYKNLMPAIYDIKSIEDILDSYEFNSNSEEFCKSESYTNYVEIYSYCININGKIFVTYPQRDITIKEIELFPIPSLDFEENKTNIYDNSVIELTDDESSYVKLILLSLTPSIDDIKLSFSGSVDKYNLYEDKLLILASLLAGNKKLSICRRETVNPTIKRETEYVDILNRYWGYSSFKPLKMYKDVTDDVNYKETIEISQSQIINDIVTQAELALESTQNNIKFRDVFVTSPTGAGKSIMFQIPAIYMAEKYDAMTIVISPLIGLMVDQVEGLHNNNIKFAATINSEISPVEKLTIKEKIRKKEISILYISPETLLSRSDITDLIGQRKVSLLIIDEAHIVTTWGKSFRADYWYLGDYLDKLRSKPQLIKDENNNIIKQDTKFPICTFTATSIFGGAEDMYRETKDSLKMITPISYFGYVKRENIINKIRVIKNYENEEGTKVKATEYLREKFTLTLKRLEIFTLDKQKTLVYFPTVTLINQFLDHIKIYGTLALNKNLSIYHGKLDKQQKNEYYLKYKNNETTIMLATKAFGMGIDIPDILNVYHFAPTGNVCDYIQEIGRAARALDTGYAYVDYFSRDFTHVNRLHGISMLKNLQLIQIVEKILKVYKQNNYNRRLLISCDEFKHIFSSSNNNDSDDSDVSNKVKIALMILQKDFILTFGYSPIMVKPRSLFTNEYFVVPNDSEAAIINRYSKYLKLSDENTNFSSIGKVYSVDMKFLWEDTNNNISFPSFKFTFYSEFEKLGLTYLNKMIPVVQLDLNLEVSNFNEFLFKFDKITEALKQLLNQYALNKTQFTINMLSEGLMVILDKNKYYCLALVTNIIDSMMYQQSNNKKGTNFSSKKYIKRRELKEKVVYTIENTYDEFFEWLHKKLKMLLTNKTDRSNTSYRTYINKNSQNKSALEEIFVTLGILETMGLMIYEINGGDSPQIYIHVNSEYQLNKILRDPKNYKNQILQNVKSRHKLSVSLLEKIFKEELDTVAFWNLIEEYFLGRYISN